MAGLAEWVAAVGASGAFGVVAVAMVWQVREFGRLRDRDQDERKLVLGQLTELQRLRESARKEQASHVWAMVAKASPGTPWSVYLNNGSAAPVVDVDATILTPDSGKIIEHDHLPLIPPLPEPWKMQLANQANVSSHCPVELVFTDASGVRWRRQEDGTVAEQQSAS